MYYRGSSFACCAQFTGHRLYNDFMIAIAWGRETRGEGWPPYRHMIELVFLHPGNCLIWMQHFICLEHGRSVYQDRICAFAHWPVSFYAR
jgi:hypothetical protein